MERMEGEVRRILHSVRTSALQVYTARMLRDHLQEQLARGEEVPATGEDLLEGIGVTGIEIVSLELDSIGVIYETPSGQVCFVIGVHDARRIEVEVPVDADEIPWGNLHVMEYRRPRSASASDELGPGERVVDGHVYYSSQWLDGDES